MTRLIISTTIRNANPGYPSGFIYVYDLKEDLILRRIDTIESPYRYVDPNPRGGLRGAKGISINEDYILISNTHSIFLFDKDWILQQIISHPSCAGIHDILIDEKDNIWVTSTRNDILYKFDFEGEILEYTYLRQNKELQQQLDWKRKPLFSGSDIMSGRKDFRDPRTHSLTKYDSTHLNSICKVPGGGFLISLGLVVDQGFSTLMKIKEIMVRFNTWHWVVKINHALINLLGKEKDNQSDLVIQPATGKSAVVRIWPDGRYEPCLVIGGQHIPSHSVTAHQDGSAFYMNSARGDLVHFKIEDGRVLSNLHITKKFLRGALILSNREIIVGGQNALVLVNFQENRILRRITLSDDVNEAIFSIKHLPETYSLPPETFSEELRRYESIHGKHIEFNNDK